MRTLHIIQITVLTVLLLGCESGEQPHETDRSTPAPGVLTHPLDQAVLAFVGNSTRSEIKSRMDVALQLYGLQLTEENYRRAGSALVALRKQNGTPEMAILGYMIRSHVDGVNLSFAEGASIASTVLATGEGDAYAQFAREFEAGADCSRLFELRNAAKRGASSARQEEMNTKLRSVQCFSSTAKRVATGPSNTASYTVQQYRIYREVIASPISVPEAEVIDSVARKHAVPSSVVRDAVKHVQAELLRNQWFASPDAEIRHALDWNGETQ
jgi:hypothetical protein